MLLAMAVSVTIMLSDSTNAPEIRVTPNGFMSFEACETWMRNMRSEEPTAIDSVSGKRMVARYFQCVPTDTNLMMKDLQSAMAENG